jgi:prepilin-type N-terminal cleavage/methylation domain-containing protein
MKMLLNQEKKISYFHKVKAFTLVEVLIALAITAISLIPLLHLLVISISAMDSASCLSQASLIANAKLAEAVSRGYPKLGTENGIIDNSNVLYEWHVNITDEQQKITEKLTLSDLRKVNVSVLWSQGQAKRQINVSTLISPERAVTETVSNDKES